MNHHEVRKFLAAFADGELDVPQSLRVLEQMAMDPSHARRVMHQQQLRQAVAQAMNQPERHKAPDDLAQRVHALALEAQAEEAHAAPDAPVAPANFESAQAEQDEPARSPVAGVLRWTPTAIAAALLIAASIVFSLAPSASPQASSNGSASPGQDASLQRAVMSMNGAVDSPLSPQLVSTFSMRHVRCAEGLEQMLTQFRGPGEVKRLPQAIAGFFNQPLDAEQSLDLSGLGYQYVRAANCVIPADKAVHVLYKAEPGTGRSDALSLWMCKDTGKYDMKPDKIYIAADAECAHPIVTWKHQGMVYFLVGDAMPPVHKAAGLLALAK